MNFVIYYEPVKRRIFVNIIDLPGGIKASHATHISAEKSEPGDWVVKKPNKLDKTIAKALGQKLRPMAETIGNQIRLLKV